MILSINDINQIVETERLLQLGSSKENFFLKSFEVIGPRLKKHFGKDYLFFNLYYVGADFTLIPIRLESGSNSEARLIAKHLAFAEEQVKNKKSKSFTEIILTKSLSGLVLHNSKKPVTIGDVVEQDVTEINYKETLASKLKEKVKSIDSIAEVYNSLAASYRKPFFIHFIRPFASHQHYNGIFLLFLKRQLTEDEYTELALVWSKVLSEPQIDEFSRESKRKLLDSLNKELSHTWNGYFESLKNIVQNDIIPAAAAGDLELVKKIRDHLLATVAPAARVQRFFTYLNKASEATSRKRLSEEIKTELQATRIDIKKVIEDTLRILFSFFNPPDNPSNEELNAVKDALHSLQEEPTLYVHHNVAAIEIVLFNLMKNALVHSSSPGKSLKIKIEKDGNFVHIKITNSGLMRDDWMRFINHKKVSIEHIEFAYGIRSVKRIAAFKFPGVDEKLAISARRLVRENKTEVCFKIPECHE